MRSSQESFDLIVNQEVGSKALYEKKYQRPDWPGLNSGVTIGIGYDLGQTGSSTIKSDWTGVIDNNTLDLMLKCSGFTGLNARTLSNKFKNNILIPWDKAIEVHRNKVIPRWEQTLEKTLPNTDILNPNQFGALVSLIYNRGPSFQKKGDRYTEMRNIFQHMETKNFSAIPNELRKMKRLWKGKNVDGLLLRRDLEAKLFEKPFKNT